MLKTPITPPRVAFVDPQTGNVSREWYMFFLSLYQAIDGSDLSLTDLQKGPAAADVSSLLAAASADVSPPVNTPAPVVNDPTVELPPSSNGLLERIAELQQQLDLLSKQARSELGTLAPVNIDSVPYLGFDTAPSWIGSKSGQLWFDPSTNQLNVKQNQVTQQIGEELFRYGKASSAISDTNLQLVYKTGVVGASGVIKFAPAVAGITDPDQIIGIATESIALNGFGRVTTFGVVHGVNTTGSAYSEIWADNDDIWYDPVTGGLTKTKPVAPNIKLMVGTVINAGAGSGSFSVKIGSTSELGGTDSNVQLGTLADKDLLQYNGTYWENVTSSDALNVAIKDEGTTLTTTPTSIDFVGAGVVATTVGNDVTVTITGGGGGGGGTVTNITGVNSNGFSWSIANPTTTPALTLSTTVNGIAIGNGTSFSNLTVGTGLTYSSSTLSVTGLPAATKNILASDGSSGVRGVTIGTGLNYDTTTNTLSNTASGSVISVSATAPVASTGGTTPVISMTAANGSTDGYLTSTDWNTFNNKQAAGSYLTSVTADSPLVGLGTSGSHLAMPVATSSANGYLSSTDWSAFNAKAPATSGTDILKGNGAGGFGSVTIGTGLQYSSGTISVNATTGTDILRGNGAGQFSNIVIGTGLTYSSYTLSITGLPAFSKNILASDGAGGVRGITIGTGLTYDTVTNTLYNSGGGGTSTFQSIYDAVNTYDYATDITTSYGIRPYLITGPTNHSGGGNEHLQINNYVAGAGYAGAAMMGFAGASGATLVSGMLKNDVAGIVGKAVRNQISGPTYSRTNSSTANSILGGLFQTSITNVDTNAAGGAQVTGIEVDVTNYGELYPYPEGGIGILINTAADNNPLGTHQYQPYAGIEIRTSSIYGYQRGVNIFDTTTYALVIGTSANRDYPKMDIDPNGKLEWGTGSGAPDISLYRSSASNLTCSWNLNVTNRLSTKSLTWNSYAIADPAGSTTTYLRNDGTWATPSVPGGVTSVTATAPVQSTGGTTPVISMPVASTGASGYLSAADWDKFNGKAPATSGSSVLSGNGSGGFSNVVIGTGLTFSSTTLSITGLPAATSNILASNGASGVRGVTMGTGLTYNTSTNTLSTSGVVQIAGGASNNDYLYSVGTGTAPSDPINRAGWLKISNNAGSAVWIPFYL